MLTSVLLIGIAVVIIAVVVGLLVVGVSVLVYGPGGAIDGIRAFLRGRFRRERRPWWDFFGFTDESDVVYPLPTRVDRDAEEDDSALPRNGVRERS